MEMLEIKQLTRLQIIRYCEKLEKENKTNDGLVKYWKAQYEEQKKELKSKKDKKATAEYLKCYV